MPWLAESTVQQVKQYNDIVGIIGNYLDLKRRGRNYIGLCPFHSERTPSFTVSPDKGIFHCFGCHESGDLISFIIKIDNLTFIEAIEKIAEQAGIEIEYDQSKSFESSQDDALKESVRHILYQIRLQFTQLLDTSPSAMNYLTRRGLSDETIKSFHLGYAAPAFNLLKWSEEQRFTTEQLKKTGLFFQTEQGALRSRFKNRIVFPIIDEMNRTIGFGGRVFELDQQGAKYVNSEESIVFNKRQTLYGISLAKSEIKKQKYTILVEGYMDVLICHQYGFKNVIAIMGTALTTEQAQKIKRLSSSIILCMDSDSAGQTAIERSCELLLQTQYQVKVMQLEAKDPAEFLMSHGRDAFQEHITNAVSIIDFMFDRACQKWSPKIIENIPKIIECIIPYLRAETERIIQTHYVQKVATVLNIEPELIMAKILNLKYNVRRGFSSSKNSQKSKRQKAEEFLIVFSATDLVLRKKIFSTISPDQLTDPLLSKIASKLIESESVNAVLIEGIKDANTKRHLTEIILKADALNLISPSENELEDYISLVISDQKEKRISEIKDQLKTLEKQGDEEGMTQLLQELHGLKIK